MMSRYRSQADLGGSAVAERVQPEPEGELFHAAWEPQVLALTLAMGATGEWNIDASRAARETLPRYAALSYYEIWFHGLLVLLAERGLVQADELAAGRALHPARPLARGALQAASVPVVLARGAATERVATEPARFVPGQAVRMYAGQVPHHTRLPGYVRGRRGVVEALHGAHVFADANAHGHGEKPQWLYTVVFEGSELWGDTCSSGLRVSVDAWEPYLEAV
jgi:nitrile hydratase subunit beta